MVSEYIQALVRHAWKLSEEDRNLVLSAHELYMICGSLDAQMLTAMATLWREKSNRVIRAAEGNFLGIAHFETVSLQDLTNSEPTRLVDLYVQLP